MNRCAAFGLASQILAAQRNAAGDAAVHECQIAEKVARYDADPARSTIINAIQHVLLSADKPLLAPEIRARMPKSQVKSIGPALLNLVQRGAIRRCGIEGKYRYVSL